MSRAAWFCLGLIVGTTLELAVEHATGRLGIAYDRAALHVDLTRLTT